MISICITVKNRSRVQVGEHELYLFPNCVRSIVESVGEDLPCELVVADWHSDDWPLEEWLEDACYPIPVKIIQVDGSFSRGRGLNVAARVAAGEALLFLDADMLLDATVLVRGLQCLRDRQAFFPIVLSYLDAEHKSGGWPDYDSWGLEDTHFYERIASHVEIVREQAPGLRHQWHPEDIFWKDRYSAKYPDQLEFILTAMRPRARQMAMEKVSPTVVATQLRRSFAEARDQREKR